jgi:hypothetical protein
MKEFSGMLLFIVMTGLACAGEGTDGVKTSFGGLDMTAAQDMVLPAARPLEVYARKDADKSTLRQRLIAEHERLSRLADSTTDPEKLREYLRQMREITRRLTELTEGELSGTEGNYGFKTSAARPTEAGMEKTPLRERLIAEHERLSRLADSTTDPEKLKDYLRQMREITRRLIELTDNEPVR